MAFTVEKNTRLVGTRTVELILKNVSKSMASGHVMDEGSRDAKSARYWLEYLERYTFEQTRLRYHTISNSNYVRGYQNAAKVLENVKESRSFIRSLIAAYNDDYESLRLMCSTDVFLFNCQRNLSCWCERCEKVHEALAMVA